LGGRAVPGLLLLLLLLLRVCRLRERAEEALRNAKARLEQPEGGYKV